MPFILIFWARSDPCFPKFLQSACAGHKVHHNLSPGLHQHNVALSPPQIECSHSGHTSYTLDTLHRISMQTPFSSHGGAQSKSEHMFHTAERPPRKKRETYRDLDRDRRETQHERTRDGLNNFDPFPSGLTEAGRSRVQDTQLPQHT